jgi:SAM-dependent methyltransferase
MSDDAYHRNRFRADPRRRVVWQTLVDAVFQKEISAEAAVLDLGAGYGDFINSVKARRRLAVDCWAGMPAHLEEGVEGLVTTIDRLEKIADGSLDYVFSSNCFEHVPRNELLGCLAQLRDKMKPGARLTIVQPNYKHCVRQYFDDYTHVSIYTDQSLGDVLAAERFRVDRCIPRFLPLTMRNWIPAHPMLIRLYLASPIKPLARQMLISAIR